MMARIVSSFSKSKFNPRNWGIFKKKAKTASIVTENANTPCTVSDPLKYKRSLLLGKVKSPKDPLNTFAKKIHGKITEDKQNEGYYLNLAYDLLDLELKKWTRINGNTNPTNEEIELRKKIEQKWKIYVDLGAPEDVLRSLTLRLK